MEVHFEPGVSLPANKPQTVNPRNRNRVQERQYPSSARSPRPNSSNFLGHVDIFLDRELATAKSDADKVYVYQRAFDYLTQEFNLCKPLLQRIKQEYDKIASGLIAKKRVIMTDSSSVSAAEDAFSEMVNKMRRARTQEFTKRRQETEKLLDEMTQLRCQRSELQHELETLQAQRKELKTVEKNHSEKMTQMNSKLHELLDNIKQVEVETSASKREIFQLEDKIEKTVISSQDLVQSDQALGEELAELGRVEEGLKQDLARVNEENKGLDVQLQELHKELLTLTRENVDASERLKSIKDRRQKNDAKMRTMLAEFESNPNVPVATIIQNLLAKRRN